MFTHRVTTNLEFRRLNEAATSHWLSLFREPLTRSDEGLPWLDSVIARCTDDSEATTDTFSNDWRQEHMGCSWCYFEELNAAGVRLFSAKVYCDSAVQALISELAQIDPNLIAVVSYTHDSPDFAGWEVYLGDESINGNEFDRDEIEEFILEDNPELNELDEDERSEQLKSIFDDAVWEAIDTRRWDEIEETLGWDDFK